MALYEYQDKQTCPNLDQIMIDVETSEMTNKSINRCKWEESLELLYVYFDTDLDTSDKDILDTIVANNS